MTLYHAGYSGFPCVAREVSEPKGETVVTRKGNVVARPGDYVLLNVDEAPTGYHSERINRVVRKSDRRLSIGESITPEIVEEDESPTLDQVEAETAGSVSE